MAKQIYLTTLMMTNNKHQASVLNHTRIMLVSKTKKSKNTHTHTHRGIPTDAEISQGGLEYS